MAPCRLSSARPSMFARVGFPQGSLLMTVALAKWKECRRHQRAKERSRARGHEVRNRLGIEEVEGSLR